MSSETTSARCDACRRALTVAEVPHLYKRGFHIGGLPITRDVYLCSKCFRRLATPERIHWLPLAALFEA
jgi:hypothetical protein